MEEVKNASVTTFDDNSSDEKMLFTFDSGEQEQNNINSKNADLLDKVKFIQFSPSLKRSFNLSLLDAALYGYIEFFSFDGNNSVYLTNEQLSFILSTSESSIKRSMKILKEKGLIDYSIKTFSNGHSIKSVRKVKLTTRVPIAGQIDPTVAGQIDPQLITSVKNISKDINTNVLSSKKEYGNSDVNTVKGILQGKYPKPLTGISDTRKLWALVTVCKKNKSFEWMDEDWKVNFATFMTKYLKDTDEQYLVGSVDKLRERIKDWREMGRVKKTTTVSIWK